MKKAVKGNNLQTQIPYQNFIIISKMSKIIKKTANMICYDVRNKVENLTFEKKETAYQANYRATADLRSTLDENFYD